MIKRAADKETTTDSPKKKLSKKKVFIALIVLLFIGTIVVGVLSLRDLQHQRDDLKKQVKTSQTKTSMVERQSNVLSSKLKDANVQIKVLKDAAKKTGEPPVVPTLTLKVVGVTKDSRGYGYSGVYDKQNIIVDVSLTNNGSTAAYLSVSDFKLKDSNDATYNISFGASWPPSANKTELKAQSVAPGETVSGSISFGNAPVSFDTFTLYYGDKSQEVTPKDATYSFYTYPWCKGIEGTGEKDC